MTVYKVYNNSPSDRQLNEIVGRLKDGEIMIWPTDTQYAIACDALNSKAIERICKLKGINPDKTNLSIVCSNISQAAEYARFDNDIFRLLKNNTPGPFTFICKASSTLPRVFKGRKTVGIRIPDNKITLDIVSKLEHPVMTTSIEYEDEDYAINPELIAENYNDMVDFMVEGGDGSTAFSTVIDCSGPEPEIIREGAGVLN